MDRICMRITRIILDNFRGFDTLELELSPSVTVLVGVNGAGKTTILDALALALSCLTQSISSDQLTGPSPHPRDVRLGASTAAVSLVAEAEGHAITWRTATTLPGHPVGGGSELDGLAPLVTRTQQSIASGQPKLPLAVYFPTNRSAPEAPLRIRTPHEFDALSAYDGALESGDRNFRTFFEWFREEEDVYNEQELLKRQTRSFLDEEDAPKGTPSPLPFVRAAIEKLLPNAKNVRVERRPQRMTVEVRGQRFEIDQLSDGTKCLLAMAGDLARRMALANPGASNPLEQPAFVLIDEIELHLHPGLQRAILPTLRKVFPHAQFVVSTHSPQVLSSVHATDVRLIENFTLRSLDRGTWQRDTNRILESVFGDPGRPPEVAEKLNRLRDAVDEDRFDEARALIRELREMVEGEDPDVFYYQQLLPPEGAVDGEP